MLSRVRPLLAACEKAAAARGKKKFAKDITPPIKGKVTTAIVDGELVELQPGVLISSLRKIGKGIPSVCWHPDIKTSGGRCRVCCCEVNGKIVPTCDFDVGMVKEVVTNTTELRQMREAALDLVPHDDVLTELEDEVTDEEAYVKRMMKTTGNAVDTIPLRKKSKYVLRHPEKCTHCGLCSAMCQQVQGVGAIADVRQPTGEGSIVEAFHNANLPDSECVSCGQCVNVCPTGALEEASEVDMVLAAMQDHKKVKVLQFAPAVRLALAEEFGYSPGERSLSKEMVEAARLLGDRTNVNVFDTNFTADLTIIEEGNELIERLRRVLTGEKKLGVDDMETALPMITSCSPGWILFCEKNYHDLIPNLSSCKSPQQMSGALTKHYWAKKEGLDPKDVCSISVMPCVAKKAEKERSEFATNGVPDVDHVITTREFAKLCRMREIDPTKLEGEDFDTPYGISTGAGLIFGVTGGVMEAALRTAYEVITGREVPFRRLDIKEVRGMQGVKEASVLLADVKPEFSFLEGVELKIGVAHGLSNARRLMDRIREAKSQGQDPPYHFVEVMACPGGCIGGGGQPKPTSWEIKMKRAKLVYEGDAEQKMRKSHENPEVLQLYKDFLTEPLGHNSHHLLHTKYKAREPESSSLIASPEAAEIRKKLLQWKHPKNSRYGLTNVFCELVDEYGHISDAAVAAVASHVGATPVAIDSIISHYHFYPRKSVTESMLFLCECLSCRTKGSGLIKRAVRARGITVQTVQWLGWCTNGAPAAFVKKRGDENIHPLLNLTPDDARIQSLEAMQQIDAPSMAVRFQLHPIAKRIARSDTPAVINNITLRREDRVFFAETGQCPVSHYIWNMSADQILQQIKISGLRGCGGAGFPTHIKLAGCRSRRGKLDDKFVVVNADEGLPCTFKDFVILSDPSARMRMIVGMCTVAKLVGARHCMLYLRYEYKNIKKDLEASFKLYTSQLNPGAAHLTFKVILGGGPYVCGEETALFESCEGRAPQARCHRTTFTTEHGLFGKPTAVNNVETLTWIPSILYHGGKNFKDLGVRGEDGLKLFSVSGHVAAPAVAEMPMGSTLAEILSAVCPEVPHDDIAGIEVGGICEKLQVLQDTSVLDQPLSLTGKPGTLPGAGSIVVFRRSFGFDKARVYQAKAKFANKESCQLCTPCRDGTGLFRRHVKQVVTKPRSVYGKFRQEQIELYTAMEKLSNCGHGKAVGKMARELVEQLTKRIPPHASLSLP
eukprot:Hpha_TRINITY_DN14992_c0_g1::TRINITY_DN14992_c0_g1_i1::g.144898::m.144898